MTDLVFTTPNPASPAPVLRVVLLNGPPGAGKDTAGAALTRLNAAHCMKLAETVKRATHALFGVEGATDGFESVKNEPSELFDGMSPRQAYIAVSEQLVKPNFGDTFFGRVFVRKMLALTGRRGGLIAVTDSGFVGEAQTIIDAVGAENVLLIRLHAPKRGCSFAGDSRTHIDLPGVRTVDVHNDDGQEMFEYIVSSVVRTWSATL